MYDRNIKGKVLDFEASGALFHNALVMQDDQTLSHWAVISSEAIGGEFQGTRLIALPLAEKTTWRQWLAKHPHTQILTVNGKAHIESNPYENYMTSEKTFRPVENPDERLSQKAPVFTFTLENEPFAIAHQQAEGGWSGQAGDTSLFIYRAKGDAVYRSTLAFLLGPGAKLKKKRGRWHSSQYGAFNPKTGAFDGSAQPEPLHGVDSYWYIWTKYYPRTALLD